MLPVLIVKRRSSNTCVDVFKCVLSSKMLRNTVSTQNNIVSHLCQAYSKASNLIHLIVIVIIVTPLSS